MDGYDTVTKIMNSAPLSKVFQISFKAKYNIELLVYLCEL